MNDLMISGKRIRGILEGESVPDIFIPQLIELNAQGRFPFEKLTTFYSLDQINQAAKDSENGGHDQARHSPNVRVDHSLRAAVDAMASRPLILRLRLPSA